MKLDLSKYDSTENKSRGVATLHPNNHNVIMNSANLFYGGAKSGKTRTLVKAASGTDYIYLDFDRNYGDVSKEITSYGGKYFNGKNAIAILKELLRGNTTDTVVIIDSLQDTQNLMLKLQYAIQLENDGDHNFNDLVKVMQSGMVGISAEMTAAWFTSTVSAMVNDSNSINFIHHTTENSSGSKLAGNSSAYRSKFDTIYKIDKDGQDTFFKLESQRSNIAKKSVGVSRTYKDAVDWIEDRFLVCGKDELDGTDLRNKVTKNAPLWVKEFDLTKLRNDIFTARKLGKYTYYSLGGSDVK